MKKTKNSLLKKVIKISWTIWFSLLVLFFIFFLNTFSIYSLPQQSKNTYIFPWPGMLPDEKLYKLKVARNKVVEKLIINPVKKVEFDLLMADKLIYSSMLLMEKGKIELAKDAALKGENYYSMLVQDYNKTLLVGKKIPKELDRKITLAARKHQEVFKKLETASSGEDKKAFQAAYNFSKINFDFIEGLRKQKGS